MFVAKFVYFIISKVDIPPFVTMACLKGWCFDPNFPRNTFFRAQTALIKDRYKTWGKVELAFVVYVYHKSFNVI